MIKFIFRNQIFNCMIGFRSGLNLLAVLFFLSATIFYSNNCLSQFAPPAGQPGTTAIHKDSTALVSWANEVVTFNRGAADIANGWGTLTSFGTANEALGYAQGNSTNVVSLGDSGSITLSFLFPIMNGPGNDFAVFENSFDDQYLEFAFVEVSSDGINFVRFPSTSLTQTATQTATYAYTDTELIHNLAGKYKQGYGTPFDLEDLIDSTGINLDSVRFVKIIDVIGTIDPLYATYDSQGNMINDPYPSDFAAGGFDLDGVGVINENNIYANITTDETVFLSVYPNPSSGNFQIQTNLDEFEIEIFDLMGRKLYEEANCANGFLDLSQVLPAGIYWLILNDNGELISQKILISSEIID